MKKFARLLKLPGSTKDKRAQPGGLQTSDLTAKDGSQLLSSVGDLVSSTGTSDIQWLTELNGQSAAPRAELNCTSTEPSVSSRDRPACLAEIQELRLRLPHLHRDSNQPSFSGKLGFEGYHVLEGRRELIRIQLLLAGSLIRLVRPLDTTAKGELQVQPLEQQ